MIKNILYLLLFVIVPINLKAQTNSPELLPIPKEWRYERMNFPLEFAPEIKLSGFEELRFAPGMFNITAEDYFTYIFALKITNKIELNKNELHDFLLQYYKGLSESVAKSKKIEVDASSTKVILEEPVGDNQNIYRVQVNFFDTFTNSQEILLHMEIEVFPKKDMNEVYLLALVSPQEKNHEVWKQMHNYRNQLDF